MPETGNPKWIMLTRASIVIGLAAFFAGIFASIYIGVQNRDLAAQMRETQIEGSPTSKRIIAQGKVLKQQSEDVAEVAHKIACYTTPGTKCFKKSQEQTAKAVVGINEGTLRVISAALSCQADGITEQIELAKCTARRAAEQS